MAIDMSKMRERLNKLQAKNDGNGSAFWRPSEGGQTIRIVAPKDGDPFKDFFFHYNVVSNSVFLFPTKTYGDCLLYPSPSPRDYGHTRFPFYS